MFDPLPTDAVLETHLSNFPAPRRGKVRDIYDLGDHLLLVATDRISAYDHVLAPGIPGRGQILHQLSTHWFDRLEDLVPHHLVASRVDDMPSEVVARLAPAERPQLTGRSALVRKATVVPFEFVVRGYLAGSAWRDVQKSGRVCGIELPRGLELAARLDEPILTPATKAEKGHDMNVPYARLEEALGAERARRLGDLALQIYEHGATVAARGGLILADTKFEFGFLDDRPVLVDEVLTPDSSRYWDASSWTPGEEPASFDKQFVRNWLDESGWDHESPPPELPEEVVQGTLARYREAFWRLTGREPKL